MASTHIYQDPPPHPSNSNSNPNPNSNPNRNPNPNLSPKLKPSLNPNPNSRHRGTSRAAAMAASSTPPSHHHQRPFRGVRMRSWGKWVSEIRQPKKRSRIWLGSYSHPEAAATAYDMALYFLRGPLVSVNFPDNIPKDDPPNLSPRSVQRVAIAAGTARDKTLLNSNGNNSSNSNHSPCSQSPQPVKSEAVSGSDSQDSSSPSASSNASNRQVANSRRPATFEIRSDSGDKAQNSVADCTALLARTSGISSTKSDCHDEAQTCSMDCMPVSRTPTSPDAADFGFRSSYGDNPQPSSLNFTAGRGTTCNPNHRGSLFDLNEDVSDGDRDLDRCCSSSKINKGIPGENFDNRCCLSRSWSRNGRQNLNLNQAPQDDDDNGMEDIDRADNTGVGDVDCVSPNQCSYSDYQPPRFCAAGIAQALPGHHQVGACNLSTGMDCKVTQLCIPRCSSPQRSR